LPAELERHKPAARKRVLGALLYRERVAFVEFGHSKPRARLTEAHEIGHQIIPWHKAAFQLDNEERLSGMTHEQLELEAYLAGGHLIFQGQRFHRHALDYQVSMRTPVALADDYGASLHATIRYYVTHHPDPVALLVAGRYTNRQGHVPLWRSVESSTFFRSYGCLADRMNGHLVIAGGEGKPLGDIAQRAMSLSDVVAKEIRIRDLRGEPREFVAEAFFNQHNLLVMVSEKRARRFGRRVRVEAS
jgi:hypothetical protein